MKEKTRDGVCPYCSFDLEEYNSLVHHLKPQTILNGKYLIGRVLGEGGFGITYIGCDLNLGIPLAIKEYFPNGFVTRDGNYTNMVSSLGGKTKQIYEHGKEGFIKEAEILGRFYSMPEIVQVRDLFQENGTAYIVMEYVVGETLSQYLKNFEKYGNHMLVNSILELMKPLIQALGKIHTQGLIHRDISPDNIMIIDNGRKAKLLDFGAAREFVNDGKSLSVLLKSGYAPEEQYRTRGKQGPWTDVYALCATIYRAITGQKIIDSLERLIEDNVKRPSELGIIIEPDIENALMKGLAVLGKDRWQDMQQLYNVFYLNGEFTEYRTDSELYEVEKRNREDKKVYALDERKTGSKKYEIIDEEKRIIKYIIGEIVTVVGMMGLVVLLFIISYF